MKLQTDNPVVKQKSLICAGLGKGAMQRAVRKVESIAMPMEGRHIVRKILENNAPAGFCRKADGEPTDLLICVWINPGSPVIGDQLGTETYPQHFFVPAPASVN